MADPRIPDIAAIIRARVVETLGVTPAEVTTDATLDALGCDELDLLEIAIHLEEVYGIDIPDDDLHACKTIADLQAVVERRRSAAR